MHIEKMKNSEGGGYENTFPFFGLLPPEMSRLSTETVIVAHRKVPQLLLSGKNACNCPQNPHECGL